MNEHTAPHDTVQTDSIISAPWYQWAQRTRWTSAHPQARGGLPSPHRELTPHDFRTATNHDEPS
ncbi:MAG: hypothetical protein M3395_09040, partial [Chloroflexota bacterium]|nr:hypothetical protein [Chloroflexota bacterium]